MVTFGSFYVLFYFVLLFCFIVTTAYVILALPLCDAHSFTFQSPSSLSFVFEHSTELLSGVFFCDLFLRVFSFKISH